MPKLTFEQLETAVNRLEGQCMVTVEQALEEQNLAHLFDDPEVEAQIQEKVFLCEKCGWWAGTEELNNEGPQELCDQCHEEEEDDED